jgi:hypothetical protein
MEHSRLRLSILSLGAGEGAYVGDLRIGLNFVGKRDGGQPKTGIKKADPDNAIPEPFNSRGGFPFFTWTRSRN